MNYAYESLNRGVEQFYLMQMLLGALCLIVGVCALIYILHRIGIENRKMRLEEDAMNKKETKDEDEKPTLVKNDVRTYKESLTKDINSLLNERNKENEKSETPPAPTKSSEEMVKEAKEKASVFGTPKPKKNVLPAPAPKSKKSTNTTQKTGTDTNAGPAIDTSSGI